MLRRARNGGHEASETGAALVELALTLPVLVILLIGTADFARVLYWTIELTNAARAGAQYGAQTVATSSDTSLMQTYAEKAAPNIPGFSTANVTASRLCQCATDAGVFSSAASCTATCPSSGHIVVTVTVTAAKTFTTISRFPGIPNTLALTRSATLRVP